MSETKSDHKLIAGLNVSDESETEMSASSQPKMFSYVIASKKELHTDRLNTMFETLRLP